MKQWNGTCRGCQKPILWVKTTKGKNMPCDPEIIWFEPAGGPETFVVPDGIIVRGKKNPYGSVAGYISHFATCPESDRFRRNRQ